MAKPRITEQSSSDDDAPEVVSKSASRANVRRDQKALRSFEAEQNARKKAQNRERDKKLKERALSTKKKKKEVPAAKLQGGGYDEISENEGGGRSSLGGGSRSGEDDRHIKKRMLRAMQDAAEEDNSDEYDEEFGGGSAGSMLDDSEAGDDPDTVMHLQEDSSDTSIADPEKDEDEPTLAAKQSEQSKNISRRPRPREPQYLSEDLFTAASASQKLKPVTTETGHSTQNEPSKKRRRKRPEGPKDIILGGRTFRTLTKLSDPKSKATARTLRSARVQEFADNNLALRGGRAAMLKAKKKGWERRPANVGAMKPDGAPSAFCRATT
ncbi:hypothetical protein EDD16DRAFT_1124924 [Pisolithus croceorrhizus]|nr:hypothetical protein EDD16DRAFT_1124924 [Pisolithus croceorrhizus]KAI6133805.1 hypothetical protein EV401DRAFT_1575765 [Pisolithus croceorrhizus]KAI6165434.1 hypothetical protein EDD17DRAFT_1754151 [Pisolithus thermaeus]